MSFAPSSLVKEQADIKLALTSPVKIEAGTFLNDICDNTSRNHNFPFDWELKEKVVKLEPKVNSEMAESFDLDDFTARMALKLIKYGEPHNSFIKYEQSTFSGASKEVEYTP